jgi:hypothetical protein
MSRSFEDQGLSIFLVFIPLWQRGIKGDFKNMFGKSPPTPLCQRGVNTYIDV